MKVEKVICDRCGKEVEDEVWISKRYVLFEKEPGNLFYKDKTDVIDLCKECQDSLRKWVKEKKNEKDNSST